MRIVLVDDERDVRTLLQVQLSLEGFEIVGEAGNGTEAVEIVRATQPEGVVLDLLMPVMSGFDAIPRLRELEPVPHVVAHTAVAGAHVRSEMKRLGIPLVLKSGRADALIAALRDGAPS